MLLESPLAMPCIAKHRINAGVKPFHLSRKYPVSLFVFLNTAICIFCPLRRTRVNMCGNHCGCLKSKSGLCKLYETSVYSGERAQPGGTRATRRDARNQGGRAQPGGDARNQGGTRYPRV